MLVLSRKESQKIRLGSDVTITVLNITETTVKIGIDAPRDIKIMREEIYEDVKKHTIAASLSTHEVDQDDLKKLSINKVKKI